MNKNGLKISYDKENGVLSIQIRKGKSVDSDIQRNIVIDYDKRGEIIRINLYNFSFDSFRNNLTALKQFAHSSKTPVLTR